MGAKTVVAAGIALLLGLGKIPAEPWLRHVVDDSSKGADGVRLADFDGDGRLDIATGWEEGGIVKIYRNPGVKSVKEPWPGVVVGRVNSAEDAILTDLDGDGAMDVVSSCEGKTRQLFVHWAPFGNRWDDPEGWSTAKFPEPAGGAQLWMFAAAADIDGKHGIDLATGSKGGNGAIGWWRAPEDPRKMGGWTFTKLYDAEWIMTLKVRDMNGDGQEDFVFTERKGEKKGVSWLEHPGEEQVGDPAAWKLHQLWTGDNEVMFMDFGDVNGDGREEIAVAVKPDRIVLLIPPIHPKGGVWETVELKVPKEGFGNAKAVALGDIDSDGLMDAVGTCESANGAKSGVFWLRATGTRGLVAGEFECRDIGGEPGVKFDRIELLDLDGDGDLDLLTCEERDQLGVIWYENPTVRR